MSVLSAIAGMNKVSSIEEAFHAKDVTSAAMQEAVKVWFALYFDRAAPEDEDDCQRLPVLVVNKLCKTVFSEYTATADGPKKDFINALLLRLDVVRKQATQLALIGGECFLKPVPIANGFDFVVVRRDCFVPLARDAHGRITSVGTAERTTEGGRYYTLLERRTVGAGGDLRIESRLYLSRDTSTLGTQVALATLEKYAALEPEITLLGVFNLGMVQVRTPLFNCVDGSSDAVAVYAPTVRLIQNINRNERQLDDEFDNGASRIIASADMLETDSKGRKKLNDKLFVAVDDDVDTVGVTVFSPALREASYLARKQEYLRNMESLIGLKRGILSEVEAVERTATEITSSEGDYDLTIQDFQQMWEDAVRELLATCDRLGRLYRLCGEQAFDPEKDVVIDWGDGVLYNRDKTWTEYQGMVQAGLLKPELALAWYFNLPHETPADLQKIREKFMPELQQLAGGEG